MRKQNNEEFLGSRMMAIMVHYELRYDNHRSKLL